MNAPTQFVLARSAAKSVAPEILANALEHIARSAARSHTQTRRIRWIEQRALIALRGEQYSDDMVSLPKDPGPDSREKVVKRMGYHIAIKHQLLDALRELEARASESLDQRPEFRAAVNKALRVIADAEVSVAAETERVAHAST